MNKVNIRVYKRGYKGTILIWNVDPLTDLQKKKREVWIKCGDDNWVKPEMGMPDTLRMGKIMDGKTDTTTIMHDDALTAETPFTVKIVFGEGIDVKEAILEVAPKNQHKAYVKTERFQLSNGEFIYADPAYIIGIHPIVLEGLKKSIVEEIREMLKQR